MLEEFIHAQTANYLISNTPQSKAFKEFFEKNKNKIELYVGTDFKRELQNPDEFLAALFYNQRFRETLKQIPSDTSFGEKIKNLFIQMMHELSELFGIKSLEGKTLFTDALLLGWDVIKDSNDFANPIIPKNPNIIIKAIIF